MKKLNLVFGTLGLMFMSTVVIAQTNDYPSTGLSGVRTNGTPSAYFEIKSVTNPTPVGLPPVTNYPGLKVTHVDGGPSTNIVEVNNHVTGAFGSIMKPYFHIGGKGNVSIFNSLRIGEEAATSPYETYKLSVDGDIIAKRCVIQVTNWADFVFSEKYELMPLNDLSTFVSTNKHLPGVPKEDEVLANGIETGEMSKILLQKVEELTLYMIQLKNENIELKNRLTQLEHNVD